MTKEQFIEWALAHGWQHDRYGHLQKTIGSDENYQAVGRVSRTYRYKLSRIAVRKEIKSAYGWVRIKSGYYSKLSISDDGKLQGMIR